MPIGVFYSYSHKDEKLREKLEKHLKLLQRSGAIDMWHDRRIGPGAEWKDEIDSHLCSARIILLLISSDFIASDYCYDVEMKLAIERHDRGEAVVIPIILRPVDWAGAPFARLHALPHDGKPITSWQNRDRAFAAVAARIRVLATEFREQPVDQASTQHTVVDQRFSDSTKPITTGTYFRRRKSDWEPVTHPVQKRSEKYRKLLTTRRRINSGPSATSALKPFLLRVPRKIVLVLCATAIAIVLTVVGVYRRLHPATVLTDSDSIVLADITNTTGESTFNGALRQALSWKLAESPFLKTISEQQMSQTLRMMNRPPDTPITREVGREICARLGLKAVVSGSIAQFGDSYLLQLDAANCSTGDSLVRVEAEARRKNELLPALGKAATQLRRKLGESLSSIKKFDRPFQATTSSLEALRAYTLSRQAALKGSVEDQLALMQHAVQLDSNFAYAYAALSATYGNLQETDKATEYAKKAFALRDQVTERERFYISAVYYRAVTGQLDQAIQTTKEWALTYPRDYLALATLGAAYGDAGEHEKALTASIQAIQLNPDSISSYGNAMMYSAALGRYDQALAYYETAKTRFVPPASLVLLYYDIAFLRHDEVAMADAARKASKIGAESEIYLRQALVEAYRGHLVSAKSLFKSSAAAAEKENEKEVQSMSLAILAHVESLFGDTSSARHDAAAALGMSKNWGSLTLAGLTYCNVGPLSRVQAIADDLNKQFPQNTIIQRLVLPDLQAGMELMRGNPSRAIDLLKTTTEYENVTFSDTRSMYSAYIRGEAYLAAHDGNGAISEFAKLSDHPGVLLYSPLAALAKLGLARGFAMSGSINKSRDSYREFFSIWQGADEGLSILNKAQQEFANLQ